MKRRIFLSTLFLAILICCQTPIYASQTLITETKTDSLPVQGIPGERTIKNFLATAMMPVGTTLYVYGGAWNFEDTGAAPEAMEIGLSPSWNDFFQSQNANYSYLNYYPYNGMNQYHASGMDCSGYLGWTIYNLMHTENGERGYVQEATTQAQMLADMGWGTKTQNFDLADFLPGDVFSKDNHVWICLGTCADGSLVILHSTPSTSITGQAGGGVQLNGLGTTSNCEAVKLAQTYMSRYYPQWYTRYQTLYKNIYEYTSFSNPIGGRFRWHIGQALSDPDGYSTMDAQTILMDLFDESFSDVPANRYYSNAVRTISEHGLMTGTGKNTFSPDFPATRSMIVSILHRLEGAPITQSDSGFYDITANSWYENAVTWASTNGIVSGYEDGSFRPNEVITREQLAAILYRYAIFKSVDTSINADLSNFADATSISSWAEEALCWANTAGLVNGISDDLIDPQGTATRAQVAVIIERLIQLLDQPMNNSL